MGAVGDELQGGCDEAGDGVAVIGVVDGADESGA